MRACDVVIAGGGPAGATCAWALQRGGLDVTIVDAARFPRDKVCAGWITPTVVDALELDLDDYRRGRTFQPITSFRTGVIGDTKTLDTTYREPVSAGIRRCEFDHYLVERSGARLEQGVRVDAVRRDQAGWIVNDAVRAPMLVGAGGHFCSVARHLNAREPAGDAPLVVAQEVEVPVEEEDAFTPRAGRPELYFCRDLKGYGWCFRKEGVVNIGIGRMDRRSLPQATAEFVAFLEAGRRIPTGRAWKWRGHAYLLHQSRRKVLDDGVMLVGDSAGLAYPESGEGIRPAVESGLLAAAVILEARGNYARHRLEPYALRLRERFGGATLEHLSARGPVAQQLAAAAARTLLSLPWFVRRVVINSWFLHAGQPGLHATPV